MSKSRKSNIKKAISIVNSNMVKALDKVIDLTYTEMIEIGFDIQKDSMSLTPVVTGNLRAGAFTVFEGSSPATTMTDTKEKQVFSETVEKAKSTVNANKNKNRTVIVGYGASYAKYVHGNPNAGKSATGSNDGEWMFLTKAVAKNQGDMLIRMANAGRIK